MFGRIVRWAAHTAITQGHPLRWTGKPVLRACCALYGLLYRLTR